MPQPMQFGFQFGQPQPGPAAQVTQQTPMRILLLGDFSGRANRGLSEPAGIASRSVLSIDVDNFDQRLAKLAPRLQLPLATSGGAPETLEFSSLDDFHPDSLYGRLEVFAGLRKMRARLLDPKTFAEAAAALRPQAKEAAPEPAARPALPAAAPPATEAGNASLLDSLLEAAPGAAPVRADALAGDFDRMIREIVAPYAEPKADPRQKEYVASVEEAIAGQMRKVLHHPAVQALEAAWRGLFMVVSRLETGPSLKLFVMDVSRDELQADLVSADRSVTATGLYKRLVEQGVQTPGGQPWSLIVGDFTFGADAADVDLLAALGSVAAAAGGPFLAAASSSVVGCDSLAQSPDPDDWTPLVGDDAARWSMLRKSSVAPWIGLALPRVLLRTPYGKQLSPIERFAFEELSEPRRGDSPAHAEFLWGNPAFACAQLLGASFSANGWAMTPGDLVEIEQLPACVVKVDGESQLIPCGEVCLTERAIETILGKGLTPLMSYRNQNSLRVARFQSLADPCAPLRGSWR